MSSLAEHDLDTLQRQISAWGYKPAHAAPVLRAFYADEGEIGWDRLALPRGLGERLQGEDGRSGPQQVASTEWGWNRPDVFKPDLSRAAYLERLATSAEEWKRKKPETPEALARRIVQFREGCTRLILAKHEPLTPKDGAWLRERCRVWSKKLDEQLAALESGGDVTSVRNQVDGVVDKLAKALRERAAHAGEA